MVWQSDGSAASDRSETSIQAQLFELQTPIVSTQTDICRLAAILAFGFLGALNANGVPNEGEEYLNGWIIELLDYQWNLLDTAATEDWDLDQDESIDPETERGWFSFTDYLPGSYRLREVQQPGWAITRPSSGQWIVWIRCEVSAWHLDFGNVLGASVEGRKFDDRNANGQRDQGEPYLNGWTVLLQSGRGRLAATTRFSDFAPGTYTLRELPQIGWVPTAPASGSYEVTMSSGESLSGRDFGNVIPTPTPTPTVTPTPALTATATPTTPVDTVGATPRISAGWQLLIMAALFLAGSALRKAGER